MVDFFYLKITITKVVANTIQYNVVANTIQYNVVAVIFIVITIIIIT
jgi:hypothetical protein